MKREEEEEEEEVEGGLREKFSIRKDGIDSNEESWVMLEYLDEMVVSSGGIFRHIFRRSSRMSSEEWLRINK